MSSADHAIVLGVGPERGLGATLCRRFASGGYHVWVAGRSEAKLQACVDRIHEHGGRATAQVTDATCEESVMALFDRVETQGGRIACAIYNVGNNTPGAIHEMEADYFENSWRLNGYGGFLFGREMARRTLAGSTPGTRSLLFTGASASLRGRPNFGAFNAAKGALRNLASAMAKEYAPHGLHVGHVIIDGGIAGEKMAEARQANADDLQTEHLVELEGLAEAYWFLAQQPPRAWTFELDLRSWQETW